MSFIALFLLIAAGCSLFLAKQANELGFRRSALLWLALSIPIGFLAVGATLAFLNNPRLWDIERATGFPAEWNCIQVRLRPADICWKRTPAPPSKPGATLKDVP